MRKCNPLQLRRARVQLLIASDNPTIPDTLPSNIDPNGPLAQVIRLVQAGVEQSVILAYVSNSSSLFNLDSDQIIYLNDIGTPKEIVTAMIQRDQQLKQMGATADTQTTQPSSTTEDCNGAAGCGHAKLFL